MQWCRGRRLHTLGHRWIVLWNGERICRYCHKPKEN